MEYCEKSTLRNCIDAGLYLDTDRVWRLFREIVEGLVHIHEQVNIYSFQEKIELSPWRLSKGKACKFSFGYTYK